MEHTSEVKISENTWKLTFSSEYIAVNEDEDNYGLEDENEKIAEELKQKANMKVELHEIQKD